jgi:hypothetical protein
MKAEIDWFPFGTSRPVQPLLLFPKSVLVDIALCGRERLLPLGSCGSARVRKTMGLATAPWANRQRAAWAPRSRIRMITPQRQHARRSRESLLHSQIKRLRD